MEPDAAAAAAAAAPESPPPVAPDEPGEHPPACAAWVPPGGVSGGAVGDVRPYADCESCEYEPDATADWCGAPPNAAPPQGAGGAGPYGDAP